MGNEYQKITEEEKLKYIVDELYEAYNTLFVATGTLLKEETTNLDNKLYYLTPVLLLCFCFIDFLRRFNYIFENYKDGKEDFNNAKNYKEFLNYFIINNEKYKEYNCFFTADDLYKIRNDLIHSFGISHIYNDIHFEFLDGSIALDKEFLKVFESAIKEKYPLVKKVCIMTPRQFLEIIKCGIKKMLNEYENQLMIEIKESKVRVKRLSDLYNELKNTTRYYKEIKKPILPSLTP
jgi:ABC-type sugar transport system permease subunit